MTTWQGEDPRFTVHRGPLGVVRACRKCSFSTVVRTGIEGAGRGYGMREGNKARGQMIQHAKTHEGDAK